MMAFTELRTDEQLHGQLWKWLTSGLRHSQETPGSKHSPVLHCGTELLVRDPSVRQTAQLGPASGISVIRDNYSEISFLTF